MRDGGDRYVYIKNVYISKTVSLFNTVNIFEIADCKVAIIMLVCLPSLFDCCHNQLSGIHVKGEPTGWSTVGQT